jgi:hypothetical protein
MSFWRIVAPVAFGLTAASAGAQETATPPPALEALARCRAIQADPERLACYDRESTALAGSIERGDVKVLEKSQIKTIRRSLFGFLAPKADVLGDSKGEDAETWNTLSAEIGAVSGLPNGRYRIVLDDGAVWQTTENPQRMREPRSGDKIEIERAALGSYWLRINGRHGVKGRRVE